MMLKSYENMGMLDLCDETMRVFAKTFPNSRFTNKDPADAKAWWKFWR